VTTLSELADACGDGSLVLGGPGECPERPQCQPGLEQTYGLKFASFSELDAGGPLTKAAIQQGEVSLGLVFSSDGALAKQG
jgi:osmoprotectant transport system substrate-binding protein